MDNGLKYDRSFASSLDAGLEPLPTSLAFGVVLLLLSTECAFSGWALSFFSMGGITDLAGGSLPMLLHV